VRGDAYAYRKTKAPFAMVFAEWPVTGLLPGEVKLRYRLPREGVDQYFSVIGLVFCGILGKYLSDNTYFFSMPILWRGFDRAEDGVSEYIRESLHP
jgi:hypothetical protein